jgi:hypothetical protein
MYLLIYVVVRSILYLAFVCGRPYIHYNIRLQPQASPKAVKIVPRPDPNSGDECIFSAYIYLYETTEHWLRARCMHVPHVIFTARQWRMG